ncbi:hypothetical protein AAT19DRAFT_12130 [Rhodotorula toruloides]|uniref:Uncharacterized protein n=1 Tax=Rhodotorula toruloides TaxID=5286 RepID=A0A2T0AFD6_RHOTO|nr:hypothetical protein AAT19DRAFT_12130 [Rhodotorula toruloides]
MLALARSCPLISLLRLGGRLHGVMLPACTLSEYELLRLRCRQAALGFPVSPSAASFVASKTCPALTRLRNDSFSLAWELSAVDDLLGALLVGAGRGTKVQRPGAAVPLVNALNLQRSRAQ